MTLKDIQARHSVRVFRKIPLSAEIVNKLKAELTMVNTHEAGISLTLQLDHPEALSHFNKSYGVFRNARNFIVAVVESSFSDSVERAGYFAEQVVLKATELGLGTCFVSGTFSRDAIDIPLRAGQQILFIVLVGYPDSLDKPRPLARLLVNATHLKKMTPADFYVERKGYTLEKALKKFPYLKEGLEAIAAAPSAMNKRPARVWVGEKEDSEVLRIGIPEISDPQFIDLGIAKCNFAEVCDGVWDWGNGAAFYPNKE